MKTIFHWTLAGFFVLASQAILAHEVSETHDGVTQTILLAQTVVPEAEKEAARQKLFAEGPDKSAGISAVHKLGHVALGGEFDAIEGRVIRAREIIFEPGAVVAVHQHQGRPGVAYIIEGEITEHRVDADGQTSTTVKQAGEVALEWTGVVHWWHNESGKTVRALVVDIVPVE